MKGFQEKMTLIILTFLLSHWEANHYLISFEPGGCGEHGLKQMDVKMVFLRGVLVINIYMK